MANVRHRDLGNAELHEPKGVATASSGQVYRANGSGSGSWEAPLKLIETREISSSTSTVSFTGLGSYSTLLIAFEAVSFSNSAAINYLRMQLGTPYRTSGYTNQVLGDGVDETNGITTGLIVGRNNSAGLDCGFGCIEVCNFNSARPTSVKGAWFSTNNNPISSTPSSGIPYHFAGMYSSAEAHEDIRFDSTAGYTIDSGSVITVYGIA